MKTGDKVTFDCDIISIGGYVFCKKGEVVTISDIEYRGGYWSNSSDRYVPKEISGIKVVEKSGIWDPTTFLEFKPA